MQSVPTGEELKKLEVAYRRMARTFVHALDMMRLQAKDPEFDPVRDYDAEPLVGPAAEGKNGPGLYAGLPESKIKRFTPEENRYVAHMSPLIFTVLKEEQVFVFWQGAPVVLFNPRRYGDDIDSVAKSLATVGLDLRIDEQRKLVFLDSYQFFMRCVSAIPWMGLTEAFFKSVFSGPENEEFIETLRLYVAGVLMISPRFEWNGMYDRGLLNHVLLGYVEDGSLGLVDNAALRQYLAQPSRSQADITAIIRSIKAGMDDFVHDRGVSQQNFGPLPEYRTLTHHELSARDKLLLRAHGLGVPTDSAAVVFLRNMETGQLVPIRARDRSLRRGDQLPADPAVLTALLADKGFILQARSTVGNVA